MRSPTSGFRFPAAALLVAFGVSGAITIVPNYGTGFGPGTPQRAVFEDKIQRWANYPCLCHYTVNIDVSMADLGTFGELPVTYPKGVEYLMAPNPDNPAEWGTLGVTDNFQYNADGYPSGARIRFNSNAAVNWSWTIPPAVPGPDQFDAWTVANHEIAHAAGFTVNAARFAANVTAGPGGRQYNLGGGRNVSLTPANQGTHTDPGSYPNDIMNPGIGPGVRRGMSERVLDVLRHAFPTPGKAAGRAIDDRNRDGVPGITEPPLPKLMIVLSGRTVACTTLTDSLGRYAFTRLDTGSYTVAQVLPPDWEQSYPAEPEHAFHLGPKEGMSGLWFAAYPHALSVGVSSILSPAGTHISGTTLVPAGVWENYWTGPASFRAWMHLEDPSGTRVYSEYLDVAGLAGEADTVLRFPGFAPGATGTWSAMCSTYMPGDTRPADDVIETEFTVLQLTGGWSEEASPVPVLPSGKAVKDGGWIVEAGGRLYVAKGYKTGDFYAYDPEAGVWYSLPPVGQGTPGPNEVGKGGNAVFDGERYIYATLGKDTKWFLRYDTQGNAWQALDPVPTGPSGKNVRGGTDLAYVVKADTHFVYLLKGYKTEFYRYDVAADAWQALPDAPVGARPKWDKGSWLVYDEAGKIYAHKAKYHEMYAFDVEAGSWGSLMGGMPFVGSLGKKKKSKDGGAGAYWDGAIYALKGGNTGEFWKFDIAARTWTEKETLPSFGSTGKKKRVKAGGDIASRGDGTFLALKGNKTLELWRYVDAGSFAFPPVAMRAGAAGAGSRFEFSVQPSPVGSGRVLVRYSRPQSGPAKLTVFDVTGRALISRSLTGQDGTVRLDLRALSAGVYLVKLEASGYTATTKLVVR